MTEHEYKQAPATLTVRDLQAGGKILVTTFLYPKEAPKGMLKALYRQRWQWNWPCVTSRESDPQRLRHDQPPAALHDGVEPHLDLRCALAAESATPAQREGAHQLRLFRRPTHHRRGGVA